MGTRVAIMILIVVMISASTVLAEHSVLLNNGFQKLTSSTLKWLPQNDPASLRDAVVGSVDYVPIAGVNGQDQSRVNITDRSQLKEIRIHICRAVVNGIWEPGTLLNHSRLCQVSNIEKVYTTEQYEVLQNVEQAARLVWKDWDRNTEIPLKAVSADYFYIAHTPSTNLKIYSEKLALGRTHWIGKIDPRYGLIGRMSVIDEEGKVIENVAKGQVLVEIEPVMYELTVNKLTTAREKVISRRVLKLGEVTLRNDLLSPMKVESVITFQWQYNSSWGQIKAMLRGLNTTIFLPMPSENEKIQWGIQRAEIRDGIQSVSADLEAGAAVQATLQANLYEVETPYTGSLLSVFEDSHTMNRSILGIWRRTALVDIEPVYGPMYYLHNNSLVPTTPTTTTITTTTELTTSPSTSQKPSADSLEPAAHEVSAQNGNSSSSLPVRDEHVMNDGRDPKTQANSENSSSIFISYSCLILCSLLITIGPCKLIT